MPTPARRGATALPWILGLAIVLVLMGVSGSFQVSSARQALERIHARRLVELTAASAFEEVCARLAKQLPRVPTPAPGSRRDLGAQVLEPRRVDPALTRDSVRGDGVELSPVAVRSSPWRLTIQKTGRGEYAVRERGLIEMELTVTVQVGTTRVQRTVTTRRFAHATPQVGAKDAQIHIDATPLVRKLAGR
jgi:hypothetical protein